MFAVKATDLSKRFGDVQAVREVSFEVEPGDIFGMLGPNGAGKTTTIRMMLDIFKPDSGSVSILGGELNLDVKRRIGYMPEERGLYKELKLEPTLIYLATLKGMDDKTARERLRPWLERLDLYDHRYKKVQELSRGMQQKAQLITTLLHEPELIVVDEPFSGLDPVNTRLVKQILEEQQKDGKAIVMSTHQMYQVEALCNRIVLIDKGQTVLYGSVDEIKRNFSGNAVIVDGHGDFSNIPGVLETQRQNGRLHMSLEIGTDPQSVFRALASRPDVKIERFELAEPSLDDIFINVVQGGETTQEIDDA
ncbi:MAG: ATP-binding cassette domain-containing protein [Anaerolineales bacterium]|jgi:ABC-2 type transport system ATP-binding protein